jgi:hypothetical protein
VGRDMYKIDAAESPSSENNLQINRNHADIFLSEHFNNKFVMSIRKDESGRESIFMFSGKVKGYTYASPVSMLQSHSPFVHELNNMWSTWRSAMA